MAHLGDVELVGAERLGGDDLDEVGAGADAPCADPAGDAADQRPRAPPPPRSRATARCGRVELGEIEARRHRLVGDRAVARADRLGLRAPFGDARGVVGMGGKPGLDGLPAVGRKHAVDIGVQFVGGHG